MKTHTLNTPAKNTRMYKPKCMEFTHRTFSSTAHFGAYREDSLHNQLACRPLYAKLSLQYKACATWVQNFLPLAYHSLDRRVGLNLPQQKNKDGQYDRSEFSLSYSMLQ